MKLYLSSVGFGDRIGELADFLGPGARVAVCDNATDYIPDEDRRAYRRNVFDPVAAVGALGLEAEALDLRAYADDQDRLARDLADVRMVWANGGNAFLLRRAMADSGLDTILRARVADGSLVYGGWSAGAVVACPSLRGIELMDDPGLADPPVWEGLGLVDHWIVPHWRSDHEEAEAAERVAAWFTAQGLPFRALRDGETIVIDRDVGLT